LVFLLIDSGFRPQLSLTPPPQLFVPGRQKVAFRVKILFTAPKVWTLFAPLVSCAVLKDNVIDYQVKMVRDRYKEFLSYTSASIRCEQQVRYRIYSLLTIANGVIDTLAKNEKTRKDRSLLFVLIIDFRVLLQTCVCVVCRPEIACIRLVSCTKMIPLCRDEHSIATLLHQLLLSHSGVVVSSIVPPSICPQSFLRR
jgi:hypothetical protein